MRDIVIVSAARTPVGSFNGTFSSLASHDLGVVAIKAAVERAGLEPGQVDEVILGQVLQAGAGMGPARQASVKAGIPIESPAWSVNQLCGSGLRSVALGLQQIASGDASIVVAGGQESMSQAPHVAHLRNGQKMGDLQLIDIMIKDGLWDAFHGYHMGNTAENIASRWQITRQAQDEFAVASQNKAEAAQKAGRFDAEIAPVTLKGRKSEVLVDKDEYIRAGATLESISRLRPAFREEGTVTAANASGINDGAAAVVLMTTGQANRLGLQPMARIASWAQAGVEPDIMGTGPIPASPHGAAEGWLVGFRSGPHRSQRGLRRPIPVRHAGAGARSRQGECQRRGDRHWSPAWRFGRARAHHASLRNAALQGQEGTRHPLHRWWDGRGHVP